MKKNIIILTISIGVLVNCSEPPKVMKKVQVLPIVQPKTIIILGTNSLEDGARINAILEASPEGAEIVFSGKFLIKETIRLLGNRSYRGESRSGTVIKQADEANLSAIMASTSFLDNSQWTGQPISIRQLQLDGNGENNRFSTTAGIVLRSWLSVVEEIHIKDMSGDGLRLTNLTGNGEGLVTTQVNGRITNCFIERSGRHGIYIEDTQNTVTDWILSDNWVAESGMDGIHLENAAGWYIERNHIYGVQRNAIYANRLFGTAIINNYIEGFGESESNGIWYGIYASIHGGAMSTISYNRINSNGEKNMDSMYRYIGLTARLGKGMAIVTDNAIRGKNLPHGTGLHYTALADSELLLNSNGNIIKYVDTKRYVAGNVKLSKGL